MRNYLKIVHHQWPSPTVLDFVFFDDGNLPELRDAVGTARARKVAAKDTIVAWRHDSTEELQRLVDGSVGEVPELPRMH